MDTKKYQVPQGTELLDFEETIHHRELKRKIEKIFRLWAYNPVQIPLFDFFDPYSSVLGKELLQKCFRMIDREGDLLLLRPDMTLFLARKMAMLLKQEELPLRLFYEGPVMRFEDPSDISANEFFQLGAELIGSTDQEADLEILFLCFKILKDLSVLNQSRLHLGNHAFYDAVFAQFTPAKQMEASHLIQKRDFQNLDSFFQKEKISFQKIQLYKELFSFIGSLEELETVLSKEKKKLLTQEELASLEYLLNLSSKLKDYKAYLRIDLSESGSQAYHTGIVFQVYCKGAASAIISGGRYDKLLGNFGANVPSLGFSFFLRKVEKLLDYPHQEKNSKEIFFSEENFSEKQQEAEKLREKGEIVILKKRTEK